MSETPQKVNIQVGRVKLLFEPHHVLQCDRLDTGVPGPVEHVMVRSTQTSDRPAIGSAARTANNVSDVEDPPLPVIVPAPICSHNTRPALRKLLAKLGVHPTLGGC